MKRILSLPLILLMFFLFSGRLPLRENLDLEHQEDIPSSGPPLAGTGQRCLVPKLADKAECRAREQEMLAATARLYFRSWVYEGSEDDYQTFDSVAHATVKDGRLLVTHNHFLTPLSLLSDPAVADVYTYLTITNWQGQVVFEAPMTDFYIQYQGAEVLVLGLKDPENPHWLAALGFRSPVYAGYQEKLLSPGMEIAQVDWDGQNTRIDWTMVKRVDESGESIKLYLLDPVRQGASGGGVFSGGVHIANNWTLAVDRDRDGRIVDLKSTAAINSPAMLGVE